MQLGKIEGELTKAGGKYSSLAGRRFSEFSVMPKPTKVGEAGIGNKESEVMATHIERDSASSQLSARRGSVNQLSALECCFV